MERRSGLEPSTVLEWLALAIPTALFLLSFSEDGLGLWFAVPRRTVAWTCILIGGAALLWTQFANLFMPTVGYRGYRGSEIPVKKGELTGCVIYFLYLFIGIWLMTNR